MMDTDAMKRWINTASYEQLLRKWRFSDVEEGWFMGDVGQHFSQVMTKRRLEMGHEASVRASKNVGWVPIR